MPGGPDLVTGQVLHWDFVGFDMALLVLAVGEAVLLEEPATAAVAVVFPCWALFNLLVGTVDCPCFGGEHADFGVRHIVCYQIVPFAILLFLVAIALAILSTHVFLPSVAGCCCWVNVGFRFLLLESWREFEME
jgi:hypothetical protein